MSAQFWLIIAALLVLALLILVLPLLKKRDLLFVDAEQRNLSIARQQLAELKLQLQQGLLSEAQYHAQYQELQQSLQDDLDAAAAAPKPVADDRWIIPLLLFLMPLLSLGLYFHLADPEALQKTEVQQARDKSVAELHGMIVKIIERLKQNPNDMEGWMMLGRSYSYLQEYAEAANVFEKLNQMQPDNVQVLLSYADTLDRKSVV